MKLFYTSMLLFLFANCFAQDYRLFPKGQKTFFLDTTLGAGLSLELRYLFDPVATFQSENTNLDSLFLLGSEYSFFPDVASLNSYTLLSNGDQKLETNIGTYTILKNAIPGDSWPGLKNLEDEDETMTYGGRTLEPVLGVMDSVKNYSLSGGRVLKISKHYGLVEVPVHYHQNAMVEADYSQLKLFSINSLQPQYNLRDYRNIFWFNKGYVYGGGDFYYNSFQNYMVRLEILDKIVRTDSTIYEIARWEKHIPFPPNCGSNCDPTFDRDTFIFVVKEKSISPIPGWMSLNEINQKDYAYVEFVDNDTIFSIGYYVIFEGGSRYISTNSRTGYLKRYEQTIDSPMPLMVMDFRRYCYYPANAPDLACQEIEDLTPVYAPLNAATQIAVFYNPESREIQLSSSTISGAKISLVDAQGRSLYSTYPQSADIKIPCANTNGFYQLLIESESGNYRRGVVVW